MTKTARAPARPGPVRRAFKWVVWLQSAAAIAAAILVADSELDGRIYAFGLLVGIAAAPISRIFPRSASSELQTFELLEQMPMGVAVFDNAGTQVFANQEAARIVGRELVKDTPLGTPSSTVFRRGTDEPYPLDELPLIRALRGETVEIEDIEVVRDGGRVPLRVRAAPVRDAAGAIRHGLLVFEDIAAEASAEAERRATEERERALIEAKRQELFQFLDNVPLGVMVLDAGGELVFISERATGIAGREISGLDLDAVSREHAVYRRGTDELYPEKDLPLVRALGGELTCADDIELEIDGVRVPLFARAAPIHDAAGNLSYVVCTFEDITEQVRAETERLQGQKLESVGRLAAGIAHEINTPMQYIGDNAQFLDKVAANVLEMIAFQAELLADQGETTLRRIEEKASELQLDFIKDWMPQAIASTIEGVEAVSNLVGAMRELSHPGGQEKVPVDINHAIETTVAVSRNEWKLVAELETELDRSLPLVAGLPGELNQVFLNLVVNAAHAVADHPDSRGRKGLIRIVTSREDDRAVIAISDSGAGIPKTIRTKIFDPFFTTKSVGRGTGQGLAIARSIVVDKHDGTIEVDSEIGRGTTFTLRIPIDEPAIPA